MIHKELKEIRNQLLEGIESGDKTLSKLALNKLDTIIYKEYLETLEGPISLLKCIRCGGMNSIKETSCKHSKKK